MRLVADIGGTNTRLAMTENGTIVPQTLRSFENDDWPHFYEMLATYLTNQSSPFPVDMVIAVAGPVKEGSVTLTNRNWRINVDELVQLTMCDTVVLLNDLTALGLSVRALGPNQFKEYCHRGERRLETGQSLIAGIGTGFNVSPVVLTTGAAQCLNVEAGHVSMPCSVSNMLCDYGCPTSGFSTVERLFSGRGFTTFCQLMCGDNRLTGIDAIESYGDSSARGATLAVDQYSALLGQMLRELSFAYMPDSGIYLSGSVARAVMETAPSRCIEIFNLPCRFGSENGPNLYAINDDGAALLGCAAFGERASVRV